MPGTTGITYFKRPEHGPLGDMGNTGSDKQSLQIIEDPLQDLRTTGSYLREVVRSRSFSPAERTSTPEVPSGERWGTLHERSEALAFQQHPADNSPRQSIAQSIDKQPEMHHGAFPVHDDMLPEIGYGQDNESDTSTNPSIIQGPLGGGDGYFDQIEDRPLPFQEAPCTSGARTDFDYSGDGYGEEWVGMRHHHPTRLDDLSSEHETSPGSETTKGHIGSATPPVLQPRASPSEVRDLTSSALVGATLRGPASSLPGDTSVRTIRHTKAGTEGHQRGAGYAGKMKIEFEPRSDDNPIFSPTHCVDGFARKHQGSVAESISDVDMAGEEDEVDIVDVLLMQWIKPVLREPDRA
ncbi:hypothetical protein BU25DRAFT_460145 [Macroventuria anomochaeta]|uniref:Uncharacterized protein n=1 Tax=Macroventuria anomochaeta TaxID=301207 RepID=A0ACB6RXD3_9PLEO|nr:uncharacterized protein BU25DRAFT_460145 [Macroventuria anomochaeta]KAF2625814.1 hypothetical protein BU25DRAFT_460145 [Macroventuria anomochaeta]